MAVKITLRQFFDAQPHSEVLPLKNKLVKALGISKNSLNGYIYATQNVPVKRRKKIDEILNTEIDYETAAKQALKKKRRLINSKLKAQPPHHIHA